MVEEIEEDSMVQVITDGASNYVASGKMLMEKRSHLFWSPCANDCIDLMLADVGALSMHHETVEDARTITTYIYRHGKVLSIMRTFTGRDLSRSGATRFATNYLNMRALYVSKQDLRKMFVSDEWLSSDYSKREDGKRVEKIILGKDKFWPGLIACMKGVIPLVKVLRLVDGDEKSAMGYVYEAMDRVKEQIAANFNEVYARYEAIWNIIDERWDKQLHGPLHASGYFLNHKFHYSANFSNDPEVKHGVFEMINRLSKDKTMKQRVSNDLDRFSDAIGSFGDDLVVDTRETKQPCNLFGGMHSVILVLI